MSWETIGYECKLEVKFADDLTVSAVGTTCDLSSAGPAAARANAVARLFEASKGAEDIRLIPAANGTIVLDSDTLNSNEPCEFVVSEFVVKAPAGHEGIALRFDDSNRRGKFDEREIFGMQDSSEQARVTGYACEVSVKFMQGATVSVLGYTAGDTLQSARGAFREAVRELVAGIAELGSDCVRPDNDGVMLTKNNVEEIRYAPPFPVVTFHNGLNPTRIAVGQ